MQDSQPSTSGRQGQRTVWAAIINFERQGRADAGEAEAAPGAKRAPRYIVDVLANCTEESLPGRGPKRQPPFFVNTHWTSKSCVMQCIYI